MTVVIKGDLLAETAKFFEQMPEIATKAARMAINDTAERKAVKEFKRDMEQQVNFPAGYLDRPDRFGVTRKATDARLEAVITARDRATSLARFASGQSPISTRGKKVIVQVKRGRTRVLKKAFLVTLKNGNVGLAVRLKPGESLRNSVAAVRLDNNVYLLYGPSVDQVFRSVAENSLPMLGDAVTKEFYRQFERLSRNG